MNIDSIQTPIPTDFSDDPTESEFGRAIKDFDGEYRTMKDNPNHIILSDGRVWSIRRNRFMKTQHHRNGYLFAGTFNYKGKRQMCLTHRLVAANFIEDSNGYDEVNHLDMDKLNNSIKNLEWTDHASNMRHSSGIGIMGRQRIISPEVANEIRSLNANGKSRKELATQYNVGLSTIGKIINDQYLCNS